MGHHKQEFPKQTLAEKSLSPSGRKQFLPFAIEESGVEASVYVNPLNITHRMKETAWQKLRNE
jgi:hypothetical protein